MLVEGQTELFEGVLDRRVEQIRLRFEVVVERTEADIGALRDGLDARAGVPGLGEDLPGRADEGLTGLGTTPFETVEGRG